MGDIERCGSSTDRKRVATGFEEEHPCAITGYGTETCLARIKKAWELTPSAIGHSLIERKWRPSPGCKRNGNAKTQRNCILNYRRLDAPPSNDNDEGSITGTSQKSPNVTRRNIQPEPIFYGIIAKALQESPIESDSCFLILRDTADLVEKASVFLQKAGATRAISPSCENRMTKIYTVFGQV
jgi:hypothetical protein